MRVNHSVCPCELFLIMPSHVTPLQMAVSSGMFIVTTASLDQCLFTSVTQTQPMYIHNPLLLIRLCDYGVWLAACNNQHAHVRASSSEAFEVVN